MSPDKDEQVKPLALHPAMAVSPTVHPIGHSHDEEAARWWRSSQYLRKRRCFLWCCGCCGAFVVILGVVILVLALTLFKVKDPRLTMNSIHIDTVNFGFGDELNLSVNATLTADISLKNPNIASFSFDNSTTEFYYEGETVGVAYAPNGRIGSHSTVRMNVTVDVLTDQVARKVNLSLDGNSMNLTSFTDISGRVNVWGIYKRDVEILLNCSMTVDVKISNQEVKNKVCLAHVR
ncbi:hypothetical protein J5N97_000290 [Dioscorea zingiberensis]|uniref:Late embryogenesis abundant protein LEA-2 subgroup domain-containing protein n=1 Tax=Dioscorea zingiberensis TaxID=325984 RepID=A0A9D5BSV0_9LILI|nr:hypothetical protein J5N97_000290 [Dioscorea zingiberensis]